MKFLLLAVFLAWFLQPDHKVHTAVVYIPANLLSKLDPGEPATLVGKCEPGRISDEELECWVFEEKGR